MLVTLIDRSRITAALMVALGLVLALIVPLAYVLSGAVAAFVTLRRGKTDGLVVAFGGLAILGLLTAAMGYPPGTGVLLPGMFLAASVVVAWALEQSRSLALSMWVATALALLALLVFWLSLDSPQAFWQGLFDQVVQAAAESGQQELAAQLAQMSGGLQWRGVTGQFFGSLFLLLVLGLFWGRSWQARLVNPGGFSQEFSQLRLGRVLALVSALAFMGAAAAGLDFALSVAAVMLYVWLVPAFSLIHWLVRRYQLGRPWIWTAYLLCIMTWIGSNSLFLLFPLAGMLNEYLDVRRLPGASDDGGGGQKPVAPEVEPEADQENAQDDGNESGNENDSDRDDETPKNGS